MARKPLININTIETNPNSGSVYNMLLSGNMNVVKKKLIDTALQKRNTPVLLINLDNTSPYVNTIDNCYIFSLHSNSGYDIFSSMSINAACTYLQNIAYERGYSDEQTVQLIRYLKFIERLNSHLGIRLSTIRDINSYYYKPDVIGNALSEMYQTGKISYDEYERLNVSVIRSIKGQLIIDNLLSVIDFNLNYDNSSVFSVNNLKNGQTSMIDISPKHNSRTEINNRNAVLYSIEECNIPLTIVLNIGKADYKLVESFVGTMAMNTKCQLLVIMDDIFSQVVEYDKLRRTFSLNILGQHTGESCRKMSECFHEVYKQEKHYTKTVDNRLLADRFIDVLFHTNHTNSTSVVPVKRNAIEQHDIANLSERSFIMMNNTGTTNYFSLYNI